MVKRWLKWVRKAGGLDDQLVFFNTIIILSLLIINITTGLLRSDNLSYYLIYCLPLILFVAFLLVTKSRKLIAFLYMIIGIISVIMAESGEFNGSVFIIFSFYLFNNVKYERLFYFIIVFAITINSYLTEHTAFQGLGMIILYTFIYLIYHFTIRSDQKKLDNPHVTIPDIYISPDEKHLIELLFAGKTRQEIYTIMGKSKTSINSYQNTLLVKLKAKTFEEVLLKLGKSVKIEVISSDDNN